MLGLKAAVLQAACRGCRSLAHALALPMLASISFVTRSLAYAVPLTNQHEPDQAPLQNPQEPSTHVATPASPTHLPSLASPSDMDSSVTPSSPGSPLSPLVGFRLQRNGVSSAPSVEAPYFQHRLPDGLTPAQRQCIVELLNAQQLHYEARLCDEICEQAAQHEGHEEELQYLQQRGAQEQQWHQDDLTHAHESMGMQLADQRQQIADQRQHYKLKVRAGRHQAARQQQLHAAELSGLQQQLADQQQQFQEHVADTRQQLADKHDEELTERYQQLAAEYAEELAEKLVRQRQLHANALNGLRQHVQQLLARLQAEKQQHAAVQQATLKPWRRWLSRGTAGKRTMHSPQPRCSNWRTSLTYVRT